MGWGGPAGERGKRMLIVLKYFSQIDIQAFSFRPAGAGTRKA